MLKNSYRTPSGEVDITAINLLSGMVVSALINNVWDATEEIELLEKIRDSFIEEAEIGDASKVIALLMRYYIELEIELPDEVLLIRKNDDEARYFANELILDLEETVSEYIDELM